MPKSILVKPSDVYAKHDIKFKSIPCFHYQKTLAEELKNKTISIEDVQEIYFQMRLIRTFENFLKELKTKNSYRSINYNYPGPAHLGSGQEAAQVGQSFYLNEDDFLLGAHRNHGEVLAKACSTIYRMDHKKLTKIMETYFDGEIYQAIKNLKKYEDVRDEAHHFFMYGFISEIFAQKTGFNRGLGGSMHAFFTPFGLYPNNAIVGAAAPLTAGAALYKLINKKPGVVIGNLGDGALATGASWEALNLMNMDQFKKLWDKPYNKYPPFMMNVMNNNYAMGGQPVGETMGEFSFSKIGSIFGSHQLAAERVNGQKVLAVLDVMRRKLPIAKNGESPVLTELMCYRFEGHSTGDVEPYRTSDEVKMWKEKLDPINLWIHEIKQAGISNKIEIKKLDKKAEDLVFLAYKLATNKDVTQPLDFENNYNVLDDIMVSHQKYVDNCGKPKSELLGTLKENPRISRIGRRVRFAYDENNKPVSKIRQYQIRDAVFEALVDGFLKYPSLITYGEELRDWGGSYGVYQGLTELLPYHRLFNSPIAEAAIVGSAVGYAMLGGKICVELMYFDFLFRAGDEISNQLSKWRAMSGGTLTIPVIIRTNIGSSYGAQHSQDYTAILANIPGITVLSPATPYDAKGLMNAAMESTNPVFFIETQKIYDKGEEFVKGGVPTDYYTVPIGEPVQRTHGGDVTILTLGASLYPVMDAEKIFREKYGINCDVWDARSAVPFNYEPIIKSLQKTGKIILVNNGAERNNFMKNMAQNISEMAFDYLDGPPVVIGARNYIMPGAEFEKYIYPQVDDLLSAYHEKIKPLPNFVPSKNHTIVQMIVQNKRGT